MLLLLSASSADDDSIGEFVSAFGQNCSLVGPFWPASWAASRAKGCHFVSATETSSNGEAEEHFFEMEKSAASLKGEILALLVS